MGAESENTVDTVGGTVSGNGEIKSRAFIFAFETNFDVDYRDNST